MELRGRKVLVTGASGFLGSHLVEALVAEGATVRAMTHYRSDPVLHNLGYLSAEVLGEIEIVRGAIEDDPFVRHAVSGCDVVFHLAALIGIPYSYVAPVSYVNTNVKGTLNVLQACREAGTHRIIHTSTSECYGTARYTPIDEKHPLQGQSPYSATKIAADKMAESYYRSFSLPVVTVRPFNTFGPRQSARAVISTIIAQLLSDAAALRLGSLEPVRDMTFVTDTIAGFIAAAKCDAALGEEINLGTGFGVSIEDLAHRLMKLTGREIRIAADADRTRPEKSEVWQLISNNLKARELMNWRPEISLDEGLARTIDFFRAHKPRFDPAEYWV